MADARTRRNILLAVVIVGLMGFSLWHFISTDDNQDKNAGPTKINRSGKSGPRRKQSTKMMELLPDNTLAVMTVRSGADLQVGLKRLGLVRWLTESGLETVLGQQLAGTADMVGGPIGNRLKSFGVDARAFPARLAKLMPGNTILAIAGWHDDGATMPIPQLILIAETSKEVNDEWLEERLEELTQHYGADDRNKKFIHARLHHTTGNNDYLYHRIGDDSVRFNLIKDGKHLIISNHEPLFHEILDHKHGGSSNTSKSERRPPGALIETAPYLAVAERCPPAEQDVFIFVQSRHIAQLLRQTLPVDDLGLRSQHYMGWLSAEAFGYGWRTDGYAQREAVFALYEAGLPQDAMLSGLGGLKAGGTLAARVPKTAFAAWHGHLDGARWLDLSRRISRNLIREGRDDVVDISAGIDNLRRYSFPADRVVEAFKGEAVAWASMRQGQPALGALCSLQPGFQPRLSTWLQQLGGALSRNGRGSITVSADGTLDLRWTKLTDENKKSSFIDNFPIALRPLVKQGVDAVCGRLIIGFDKKLILMATSPEEFAAIKARLKAKEKPWGNPGLQGAWGRINRPSQGTFWLDTQRLVRALQIPLSALDGVTAVEDLEPLMPPLLTRISIVGLEGKRKEGPGGLLIESFGPIPLLGGLTLKTVFCEQLGRLFGPVAPPPGP